MVYCGTSIVTCLFGLYLKCSLISIWCLSPAEVSDLILKSCGRNVIKHWAVQEIFHELCLATFAYFACFMF